MKNLKEIKLADLVEINGGSEGYHQPPTEPNPLDPPSNPGPIVIGDGILY